jgi:hypothetical protein
LLSKQLWWPRICWCAIPDILLIGNRCRFWRDFSNIWSWECGLKIRTKGDTWNNSSLLIYSNTDYRCFIKAYACREGSERPLITKVRAAQLQAQVANMASRNHHYCVYICVCSMSGVNVHNVGVYLVVYDIPICNKWFGLFICFYCFLMVFAYIDFCFFGCLLMLNFFYLIAWWYLWRL